MAPYVQLKNAPSVPPEARFLEKRANFDCFKIRRNSTKFDVVARFHETIPTVKSVLSSEI